MKTLYDYLLKTGITCSYCSIPCFTNPLTGDRLCWLPPEVRRVRADMIDLAFEMLLRGDYH